MKKEDRELQEFRDLMPVPDQWEDAFGLKAIVGGLFVGMIMTPASMYMNLVMGGSVGSAAQWVTIILFLEVARRSFTVLRRPEIYVLYYMAGASLVTFPPLLWNQFLPQSENFRQFNLADKIPPWVTPSSPDVLGLRTFFHPAWVAPIGLLGLGMLLSRLDSFSLGYILFRLTSDVERLPFPMAPVGAQGITALADASGGKETWRWRVFSFGAMLGLSFGALYLALPAISGAFLTEPIAIFPLPFKDLTPNTETFLPAFPFMLSFDIGLVLIGMVLPFWAMVGSFIGLVVSMVANPILFETGVLKSWREGVGALATINSNYLDFYLSFGLGLTAAIAIIGFISVGRGLLARKRDIDEQAVAGVDWSRLFKPPPGRGDFPLWIAVVIYVVSTAGTIATAIALLMYAHHLNPLNSQVTPVLVAVLIFYGFVYTPLISYVSARMEGIVGQSTQIPFVREATFILTGYQGAAIWFTPFPANNHGWQALYFRQTELTGTSFRSMIKAEMFILPVVFVATVVFSQFIWRIAPVPSSAFPYAEKLWEINAFRQAVIFSSTLPGGQQGPFFEAFKPLYIFTGLGVALGLYAVLSFLGLPVLLVYGLIRGLDQSTPDVILPQFLGAMLGRYYFRKKFGEMWPQYRVVFAAGFGCGMGLIMMLSLGLVFMSKSVFQSTF
ncbi:MAG: OPT/YSL family transporter [Tepidisphaerales bacterium]